MLTRGMCLLVPPRGVCLLGGVPSSAYWVGCLLVGSLSMGGGWFLFGGCLDGDPPCGHCTGRYASYWNAFLFKLCKLAQACFIL